MNDEMYIFNGKKYRCPIEVFFEVVGGKWKIIFLWNIAKNGPMRFGALHKLNPNLSEKMLSQQLHELEVDGLINRALVRTVPLWVEYSLSDLGQSLVPIMSELSGWSQKYLELLAENDTATPQTPSST